MCRTPHRHNMAYSSRNGTVKTRATMSAIGSTDTLEVVMPVTVGNRDVE